MSLRERLLPQPVLSLVIATLWLLLASDASAGNVLLGLTIGAADPAVYFGVLAGRPRTFRLGPALRLLLVVIYDIIVANIAVARIVLGNVDRIRPAFVMCRSTRPIPMSQRSSAASSR